MKKLKLLWNAETPVIARVLQGISGVIAGIPLYYNGLPTDWQATVPKSLIWYITVAGFVVAALLNLFKKKSV